MEDGKEGGNFGTSYLTPEKMAKSITESPRDGLDDGDGGSTS